MWNISSSLADVLFAWSNVVLIVGAAAVLIGTIGSIKTAAIREEFSNERIAANEAETAKAIAESDVAKAEAAKAQLALEKFKAPRNLTAEQSAKLLDDLRPFGPVSYDIAYPGTMEPGSFLVPQLIEVFSKLNWRFLSYEGPLPRQELSLVAVKKLPPEMFAEWPSKRFFAGVTSELIGIKVLREFRSEALVDQSIKLSTDLIDFGMYSVPETTPHRYDAEGNQLPISEVLHIVIGAK